MFDLAGLDHVKILASGGLDEFELETLVGAGAPIDLFGVGTKAGVSADAPGSDMAYKLVCYDGRPVMKLSEGKAYRPGAKQVFRLMDTGGMFSRDVIGTEDEEPVGGTRLLEEVMAGGSRTAPSPSLDEIRERFNQDFGRLDQRFKSLTNPPHYPVAASPSLERLTAKVQQSINVE